MTRHLGYEVRGVDLAQPLAPAIVELLRGAMTTRGLLLFRSQSLDETQQLAFARRFGRISKQGPVHRSSPDATYVSNVRADGAFGHAELMFHSDQVYFEFPLKALMLYAIEVSANGAPTFFSSSAAVVERMPADLRQRLVGRSVVSRLDYGVLSYGSAKRAEVAAEIAEARHPAIGLHEPSQQLINMISPGVAKSIDGCSERESSELIERVSRLVASADLVYVHRWQPGDLVFWDNRLLQHARPAFDPSSRRTLRRCAIAHDREPMPTGPG